MCWDGSTGDACDFQNPTTLSIRIDGNLEPSSETKKQGFRASIDPWKLIKMSREIALLAAEKAREKLLNQKPMMDYDSLQPLPLETKNEPLMNPGRNLPNTGSGLTPLISKGRFSGSPGWFSSPRKRFSSFPTTSSGVVASPKHKVKKQL